jgi:transposase-like protein
MRTQKLNEVISVTRHSEAFKRAVIESYLASGLSKEQIRLKYGIRSKSAIYEWMQVLGYVDTGKKVIKLDSVNPTPLAKQPLSKPASTIELEAKIKLLERQLEDERLRADMYNRLIDLAEKTYKIPVRKNSNTK